MRKQHFIVFSALVASAVICSGRPGMAQPLSAGVQSEMLVSVKGQKLRFQDFLFNGKTNAVIALSHRNRTYTPLDAKTFAAMKQQAATMTAQGNAMRGNARAMMAQRMNQMPPEKRARMEQAIAQMPPAQRARMQAMLNGQIGPMGSPKRNPTLKRKKKRRKRKLSARKIGKKMRFGGVPCVTWALLADGRETSKVCIAKPKALGLSKVEWRTIERGMNRISKQMLKMSEAVSSGAGMAPNPMLRQASERQMSKFALMMKVTGGWPIARKRTLRAGPSGRTGVRPRASQWQRAEGRAPQIDVSKRPPSYFKPPKGYALSRNFGR